MEKSREEVPHGTDPEVDISGSHHFDSLLDADIVERDILAAHASGSNLFLSYNHEGIQRELEVAAFNSTTVELDTGKLYSFLAPKTSGEGYRVISILIPSAGGKAVFSVPW